MIRGAALALVLALGPSSVQAQDRSPASLMGSLIMILVVSDECRLPLSPEERGRIAAAGKKLQDGLKLSDQAVDEVGRQIGRDAAGIDCTQIGATFADVLRETLEEAERVR